MALEEHFGGCVTILVDLLGEDGDDGECRFKGGDEVASPLSNVRNCG